jgi:hypothetical protein
LLYQTGRKSLFRSMKCGHIKPIVRPGAVTLPAFDPPLGGVPGIVLLVFSLEMVRLLG